MAAPATTPASGGALIRARLRHVAICRENYAALARFTVDLAHLEPRNPWLHPMQLGYGDEGVARLRLFQVCRLGQQHLADPDGVLLDLCRRRRPRAGPSRLPAPEEAAPGDR